MLKLVWERRPTYNNDARVASNWLVSAVKFLYYCLFATAYGAVGGFANVVLVNSSWTYGHISSLWWGGRKKIQILFPPCAVEELRSLGLDDQRESETIISIGQFRPEKDHALQIRSLALFKDKYSRWKKAKLVLIGSCRGTADHELVQDLRGLVKELGLGDTVEFVINQPYSVLKTWMARASIGVHTMWNEHFGIGVVEMMAAGLLVVAHRSGGPRTDIVTSKGDEKNGFLAATVTEYAASIDEALSLSCKEASGMRNRARVSGSRFSDATFSSAFKTALLQSKLVG